MKEREYTLGNIISVFIFFNVVFPMIFAVAFGFAGIIIAAIGYQGTL